MILDRAPEPIKIFDIEWVDDGYGGGQSPVASSTRTIDVTGFILPTGFAGSGWALNMRYASQGWADTARVTMVIKWQPWFERVRQWTQMEAQGQMWTVVQAPRRWRTRRVDYITLLCELKGAAE
ncbi:hypothetical protein AB0G06_43695 [Nonomuraea dietziae]|uniref:hypothetical protein n=1 Tax=Nonomuraea dietziae TaxID=65515 RepID=UPI0033F96621